MPVHTELLVQDDSVCLKTWSQIDEDQYTTETESQVDSGNERSLVIGHDTAYMDLPVDVQGVYYTRFPAGRFGGGAKLMGEDFLPNIPDGIRQEYVSKLSGTYWQCGSYSWIDPFDPSILGGENSDAACWTIGIQATMVHSYVKNNLKLFHYPANPSHNALAVSMNTKAHPLRESRRYGAPASLFVYRPFTDTVFTDCSITMKYNRGAGFSTNVDGWEVDAAGYNYLSDLTTALPSFVVTNGGGTIDADGYDTVEFKMVDSDGTTINHATDVYLEHTGGYLPKQRIDIINGIGSFKVGALGLSSDDTFKVKIGFRNYTGLTDVNYIVI
jgi:hypothetical protein